MKVSKVLIPLTVASFVVGSLSFAYAQTTAPMQPNTTMSGSPNGPTAATTGNGVSSQTPTGGTGTAGDSTMNNSSNSGVNPTSGMPSGTRTPRADRN